MPTFRATLLAALVTVPAVVSAQSTRIGVSGGLNFVGGGSSKIGVDINGSPVTGGDRQGQFFSVFLERQTEGAPTSLRLEAFHGRLTSGPNTSNSFGRAALRDATYGAAATLAYSLGSGSGMKPYALLGAGMYATSLGTNPEAGATEVTQSKNGMGLGLHVGVGLEWSLNRTQVFTEWRYQQALHQTRGAAFMPLVVGVKFQP